uniref:Uncharacterized protein n=1 Tax=Cannabis sativa TaxID=3483 RepID=A0A803PL56_CANSA
MALFEVIDVSSTFNAMIGRPALYNLKAVTSIYHLCLKFPIWNGVGSLRGVQKSTQHYYNVALSEGMKEKMPAKSSNQESGKEK